MEKRSERNVGIFVIVIFFLATLLFPCYGIASADIPKVPGLIVWTSYGVGTTNYIQTACMADGVTKKTGMKLRILPSGNDIGRLIPVRSGTAHFSTMSGGSAYAGALGIWDYSTYEWGPQPLRQVLSVIDMEQGIGIATAANANVKTLNDLKGKRVTYVPGGTSINAVTEAGLIFAGLTWDDVIKVPAPSLTSSMKFVGEGKADASAATTTSPAMYEVERSPRGVYWPEYPPEDKAAWKRLNNFAPYFIPVAATKGVGVSKEKPRNLTNMGYPFILTYSNQNEDLVYAMIKAIDISFELYKNCHLSMPSWNLKQAINPNNMILPYHLGVVKYLKEIGVWNREFEDRQNKLIKEQNLMKNLWDEALSEAMDKKIKEQDFSEFWTRKRTESVK